MTGFLLLFLVSIACCQNLTEDATIFKCKCELNEAQDENGICVHHLNATDTSIIDVWFNEIERGFQIPLNNFSTVKVQPLVCPPNHKKILSSERPFISPGGKLIPNFPEPTTEKYCLENTFTENGTLGQRHEVCIYREPFKFCCPPNEVLLEDGSCHAAAIDLSNYYGMFEHVIEDANCQDQSPIYMPADEATSIYHMKTIFEYYHPARTRNMCLSPLLMNGSLTYVTKSCPCKQFTCVEYCCPMGFAFDINILQCVPSDVFYQQRNIEFPSEDVKEIYNLLNCSGKHGASLNLSDTTYKITKDGSLIPENGLALPLSKYCLGVVIVDNRTISGGFQCFIDHPAEPCAWRFTVMQVLLCISTIFVIMTIIVYLGVKELRNRIGGICLLSELVALLISQVNLVLLQLHQDSYSIPGCLAAGIIEIIFVLASFFWLNVMCYDVWNTFRVLKPFNEKVLNKKLLIRYSMYAWGVPLLIGMVALAMDLIEANIRPKFSIYNEGCFFTEKNKVAQWVFLYGFIAIILVVNTSFFVHLSFKILPVQMKQRKKFKSNMSTKVDNHENSADMENIKLYMKLFVIMGLPWLVEVVTTFFSQQHQCYLWILDMLNLMRGILIFIIFVCLKSTRDKIKATWFPKKETQGDMSNGSSDRSRKTSSISLSSIMSSARKISTIPTGRTYRLNHENAIKEEDEEKD